jgi:hypothetical protein
MLKFYIVKRDDFTKNARGFIVTFDTHEDLEKFLAYNRANIEEIKTLDIDTTYSFTDANGITVSDLD